MADLSTIIISIAAIAMYVAKTLAVMNATKLISETKGNSYLRPDILFLKHACSILRQSSNPACGFFMMEQVRFCTVCWPTENCRGSSMDHIRGRMTV